MNKPKMWSAVYRTGGTARGEWRRTLPTLSRQEAEQQVKDLERAGYKALLTDYGLSMRLGLPDQDW